MSKKTNNAFVEGLRRLGRPTSVDDLRRLGTARFRTVRSSDISLLIERALNRTLLERTLGPVSPEQRSELLSAAEEHFARQLESPEDGDRSRRAGGDGAAQPGIAPARPAGLDEARLSKEILDCLKPLLVFAPPEGLAREVAGSLRGLIGLHVAEQLAARDRDVAALRARLEQIEALLARVSGELEIDLDGLLASGWRASFGGGSVQDESGAGHVELRRTLLERILASNLDLRARA